MLKIRLRRMGAIRQPHYRVVVADSRSPRDGRFIENLGHYNPLTDPATIQIDVAKYEEWKRKGAQPTEAVVGLIRQLARAERQAAASGGTVQPTDRRTRTASGKGMSAQETADAQEAAQAQAAPAAADAATAPAPAAEESSEAVIGESAEEGTSANPGAAEETEG